jgi:hypothetical protein
MIGSKDSDLMELHTKAAYAHEAAAHGHSTGDHASAQELARKALGYSVEAVRHTEEIAKSAPQFMHAERRTLFDEQTSAKRSAQSTISYRPGYPE